jgi:DNA invertase Pin-like site-specific DNA recombinase
MRRVPLLARSASIVLHNRVDKRYRRGQPGTLRKLRRSGLNKSEIARRLNIGRTSVRRILDERA